MNDKYEKEFICELSDFFYVNKSEPINKSIVDHLNICLKSSPYTKNELAQRLNLTPQELESKLNNILTVDDIVHISGALGYKFEFNFIKEIN